MESIFKQAIKIVKKSAKIYHNKTFIEAIENYKYEVDDVTNKDIETQKYLVKKFSKLIKNCGFIAEEKLNTAKNKDIEFVWIIDPIDGTYNYKTNITYYGTQVALQQNGKTIFSVLHIPATKSLYYSYNGKSYLNGTEIFTSKNEKAKSIYLNVHSQRGRKFPFPYDEFDELTKHKKLRILGSSMVNFAILASGNCDCLLISNDTIWDIEPGLFLSVNAGAKFQLIKKYGIYAVCANQEILNWVVGVLKEN